MKKVIPMLIVQLTLSTLSTTEIKLANGLSIDLFHYHSPLSPFYNSSMNESEILLDAALRSISRHNILMNLTIGGNKIESGVISNGVVGYLVKILIGVPPVESYLSLDTGSSLVWMQCLPCTNCYPQDASTFDPSKSSSYKTISCDSPFCSALSSSGTCTNNKCRYKYGYADGTTTIGELASDTIGFGPSNSEVVTSEIIFGCGHENTGKFNRKENGIAGLGYSPLSLTTQLGNQLGHVFSYCFVSLSSTFPGKIIIGNKSTMVRSGFVTTKLIIKPQIPFYYVTLEAISVYDEKVSPGKSIEIFIDTGTPLSRLEQNFYRVVENSVISSIEADKVDNPTYPFTLCYEDSVTLDDVPDITFHFTGADLLLSTENMFGSMYEEICFLIIPSDYSIFGTLAQINFKIEYDLPRSTVTFQSYNCGVK